MDYKELLKKYMNHIVECEGTDFHSMGDDTYMKEEDWEEIERLWDEDYKET